MADRIAVMNNGRIEQYAPPGEIYDRPATRFVAGFIGTSNLVEGAICDKGQNGAVIRTDNGLLITARAAVNSGRAAVCLRLTPLVAWSLRSLL